MKELFISLLLGIAIGAIVSNAYYDGVVAQEYKLKIAKASDALLRADIMIKQRDGDINALLNYVDYLNKKSEYSDQQPNIKPIKTEL